MARTFRDLRVYQAARGAAAKVFELTKTFPKDERFVLVDQMRRASRSVKSQIAEAWGRRRHRSAFSWKLVEALGEATEMQSSLDDALDCLYIEQPEHEALCQAYESIGAMLSRMIDRSADFCPNDPDTDYRIQESPPDDEWFTSSTSGL